MPPSQEELAHDVWTEFSVTEDGEAWALSWTCYACKLDPETGAIVSSTFTK